MMKIKQKEKDIQQILISFSFPLFNNPHHMCILKSEWIMVISGNILLAVTERHDTLVHFLWQDEVLQPLVNAI